MSSMRWKLAIAAFSAVLAAGLPAAVAQRAPDGPAKVKINKVNTFEVSEGDAGTMIRIKGSNVPTFSVFKLADPPRLFIDLSHSALAEGDGEVRAVDNGVISQVAMIGVNDSGQDMTRVIVGFEQAAHYDVRAEGNDVLVFIDGSARRAPKLDGKTVDAKISAAANAALEEERQRYERELGSTRTRLKDTERELELLREQAKSARGQLRDKLDAQILEKNKEVEQARKERSEAQEKLARAEAERADALARAERAEAERSEVLSRAERAEKLAKTSSQEKAETLRMLEAAQARQDELARETLSLKQREAEANDKASSLSARAEQLEQELAALRERASKSGSRSSADTVELARLEAAQKRNASDLKKAQDARDLAQREREQSQLELDALNQEREQILATLSSTKQELDSATARAGALEKDLRREREQLDAMKGELDQLEQARAALEEERQQLKQRNADLSENQARARELENKLASAERDLEKARATELARLAERSERPAAQALPIDVLAPNMVKDIRLETTDGRSRIVVELDRPGNFETLPGRESRAVMILNNTELPEKLERTLASDAQGGAVRFVSSFIDEGQVRMEAELGGEVAETVRAEGNTLVWEFAPALASADGVQQGELPSEAAPKAPVAGDSFTSAPPMIVTDPTKVTRVPGMSRKRLTIDLRNADIQNVLRLISREGGVNIIAGDDVSGTVTMRLRGVPLEEAFLTILQSQGLGFEKRSNVIRVTTQAQLLEEQKARAEARQALLDSQPLEVFLLPVNYAQAADLTGQIQGILSQRGSVTVDERTNTLIITDIASNLEPIRVLIESLDTQVPQVLIEARIVETNDTFQRQIGIQWGGQFGVGGATGNPTGLIFPSSIGLAGGATDGQAPVAGIESAGPNPNYAVNLPAPIGTGSGGGIGLSMGSVGGSVNLNLRLSALEEAGHARIVSAPKILTLDNNEASISQGTSIPISVVGAAGVQTVFVQAVLELVVTPHVTPDGNIQLNIRASKNEPDFQNTGARGDPTIIRRDAETELLIKDGDTTVIGGIYTRNSGDSVSAVPFLHKIPILGFFFRSRSESERRSELLIFITPRIVNRAEALGTISAGSVQAGGGNGGGNAGSAAGGGGGGGQNVVVQPF